MKHIRYKKDRNHKAHAEYTHTNAILDINELIRSHKTYEHTKHTENTEHKMFGHNSKQKTQLQE